MPSCSSLSRNLITGLLAGALAAAAVACEGADDSSSAPGRTTPASLYLRVEIPGNTKMSGLKPGNMIEGSLARDVFSTDRQLFSTGSRVRFRVDHLAQKSRARNDRWPWVVKVFTPRHEKYPVFQEVWVSSGGEEIPLQASLLSVSRKIEVRPQKRKGPHGDSNMTETRAGEGHDPAPPAGKESRGLTMIVEAREPALMPGSEISFFVPDLTMTVPGGTRCRVVLLGDVSASKSRPGEIIHTQLLEPIGLDSRVVLPAGSIFEGTIVKATPARRLSRSGQLLLKFTAVTLPGGNRFPVAASLAGVELDRGSHTRIDAEGHLRGERPGAAWMLINAGVTAGISKEVDDGAQLIIEALISTATDASTAGTARIVSSCISGIFMATRRGRDVVLPRFTEMDISLDRPLIFTPSLQAAAAPVPHGD